MTASEMRDTPEFLVALERALKAGEDYDDTNVTAFRFWVLYLARKRVEEYQRLLP